MPVKPSSPPAWIVRRSSIHHRGVFARRDIPKEAKVIEYVGERITKAESDRRGQRLMKKASKTGCAAVYIFTINKKYDLDGGVSWNPARLINHSCDPNCEAIISRGRIWIYAKRDIAEGEELTFNYGFDIETWEDHPCRCGSERCVGYILDEDLWPQLRAKLKERDARARKIAQLEARLKELRRELRSTLR
jgi:SET domain-containing protein